MSLTVPPPAETTYFLLQFICIYTKIHTGYKQHQLKTTQDRLSFNLGPSGVRALPLGAGINEGGHYFRNIIPLFSFLFSLLWQAKIVTTIN